MRLVRQLGVEGESLRDCVSIHVRAFTILLNTTVITKVGVSRNFSVTWLVPLFRQPTHLCDFFFSLLRYAHLSTIAI